MGKLRDRFTFANVVSVLALLLALGLGTAWAATGLTNNAVQSRHIAKGQVKTQDLGRGVVTSAKVKNGTLLSKDFGSFKFPASGIQRVVQLSLNEDVDSHSLTVPCPLGKQAMGGGGGWVIADSDPANVFVLEKSVPSVGLDGWSVTVRRLPGGVGTWVAGAEAVCMDVGS